MNFKVGDKVGFTLDEESLYGLKFDWAEGYIKRRGLVMCEVKIVKCSDSFYEGSLYNVYKEDMYKISESKHSRKRHLLDAIQVED